MPTIGIFGGTFDPPHIGHLILAAEARAQLNLERLLWVLTPNPPHKQDRVITPLHHRLAMVKLALSNAPEFELSAVDMDRPSPHYAVDTVKIIAGQNPGAGLAYLMGGDSLHDLPFWHRPAEFVAACDQIAVMRRPGDEINLTNLERRFPGLKAKVRFLDVPLIDISAQAIRRRMADGKPFRFFLPEGVYEYILLQKLYQ